MFYYFLNTVNPNIPVITTRAIKKKKIVLAIEVAPSEIPVKPNTAAMIAITKNMAVHFSIIECFKIYINNLFFALKQNSLPNTSFSIDKYYFIANDVKLILECTKKCNIRLLPKFYR